jgi:hypothetical protein
VNNCLLTKQPSLQLTPKIKVRKILDTTDYHKHYSVASAIDEQGRRLGEARIDGNTACGFRHFFNELPGSLHVVLEACWNWHKLY